MNILILGGTGAMGKPLAEILSKNNSVYVTSRVDRVSDNENIFYIKGNAKDKDFLSVFSKIESMALLLISCFTAQKSSNHA